MDDVETTLSALLSRGDLRGAAAHALRAYGPDLLGYLTAVLHDDDAARDVFGDVAERVWRNVGSFRGEGTLRAWIYRVAWNEAQAFFRRRARQRVRRLATSEARVLAAHISPSNGARDEQLARLRASLQPEEQTLLTLRVDRAMSWREIAEVLATDEAALRQRFQRLKRKLRALAQAEGLLS